MQLLKDKFSQYQAYNVLKQNNTTHPLILCIIVRFLYIPLGSKEYIILVLEYPFYANFISAFLYFFSHGIVFSAVGNHLNSISDALKKKFWSEMDVSERIEFVSFCSVISLTIFVFVYLNIWLNKKIKNQKAYKDYSQLSIKSLPHDLDTNFDEENKNLIKSSV